MAAAKFRDKEDGEWRSQDFFSWWNTGDHDGAADKGLPRVPYPPHTLQLLPLLPCLSQQPLHRAPYASLTPLYNRPMCPLLAI